MSPKELEAVRAYDKQRRQRPEVQKREKANRDAYYQKHGEKLRARNRAWWKARTPEEADALKTKKKIQNRLRETGWTDEEFQLAWSLQGGCCAICEVSLVDDGARRPNTVASDHCHKTGKLRALVCYGCNNGLGFFRDNSTALRAAAAYLETDHEAIRQSAKLRLVG